MAMVASWEEFLERALVRYVAGAKAKNGYAPTAKFGLANTISHAYALLSGNSNYDPLKHYLKVTDTKWVKNNADYFFRQHSFSTLQAHAALLDHATTIRNRVAHSSEKCRADFKTTALFFLNPANGKLTNGYMPGNLLLSPAATGFSNAVLQGNPSHFEAYARFYKTLATTVVPT